jgi:hypothetical protein
MPAYGPAQRGNQKNRPGFDLSGVATAGFG